MHKRSPNTQGVCVYVFSYSLGWNHKFARCVTDKKKLLTTLMTDRRQETELTVC